MKKFLALILALVMALSLVACGSTPAQQPDSGSDTNVETNVETNDDANNDANSDADVKTPVVTDGAILGEGAHSFTLEITDADGKTITASVNTDEKMLGAALSKLNVIQGKNGLYSTVNGVTYDYNTDHAYWAFYVDGEYAQVGMDDTEIVDGTVYKLAVEKAE